MPKPYEFHLFYPINKPFRISQEFGDNFRLSDGTWAYKYPLLAHNGMDIAASRGTPIFASLEGSCEVSYSNTGYGNSVRIFSPMKIDGRDIFVDCIYGHMSYISIKDKAWVNAGDKIGEVGTTGFSTGNHLHFGIRLRESNLQVINYNNGYYGYFDPKPYFAEREVLGMIAEIGCTVRVNPNFGKQGDEVWVFNEPKEVAEGQEKARVKKEWNWDGKILEVLVDDIGNGFTVKEIWYKVGFDDSRYSGWVQARHLKVLNVSNTTDNGFILPEADIEKKVRKELIGDITTYLNTLI